MTIEPEYAEEYTQAERVRLVVIVMLAGALVVIVLQAWFIPWLREFVHTAPCHPLFGIEGLTVLWYGLFVALPLIVTVLVAATIGWRGYKILRDGQFPPLKEKVYRRTRIRRGPQAKLLAYLHLSAFLPLLALTIWGGFQAEKISNTIQFKAEVCSAQ